MSRAADLPPKHVNPWYTFWTFQTAQRLSQLLPRFLTRSTAAFIGHLAYDLCDETRDLTRENLRVITGLQGPPLDAMGRSTFVHFIQMVADTLHFMDRDEKAAWELVSDWTGLDHLEASVARGQGTLLVTGHLGAWELGGILLASRGIPVTIVTMAEPRQELGEWRERYRKNFNIRTITLGDDKFAFVEIVRTLRANGIVALLFDRPYGENAIPVEIAGRRTLFSPAPALLHQHTGATILPAFVIALPDGHYASHLYPPIAMRNDAADPARAQRENTQLLANFLGQLLRQHPDQWYNFVRLWVD